MWSGVALVAALFMFRPEKPFPKAFKAKKFVSVQSRQPALFQS